MWVGRVHWPEKGRLLAQERPPGVAESVIPKHQLLATVSQQPPIACRACLAHQSAASATAAAGAPPATPSLPAHPEVPQPGLLLDLLLLGCPQERLEHAGSFHTLRLCARAEQVRRCAESGQWWKETHMPVCLLSVNATSSGVSCHVCCCMSPQPSTPPTHSLRFLPALPW